MKTFREYLLSEDSVDDLNFEVKRVDILINKNFDTAIEILKDNPEFIEDINNVDDNLDQYNTTEQRNLVAAAFIVYSKDKEEAEKLGIDFKNPEWFLKTAKKEIIDPTRKKAKELGKENPSVEEVEGKKPESDDKKGEESEEEEPKEKPEQDDEKGKESEEEEEEEEEEEGDEEDKKKKKKKGDESDDVAIDKSEFPPPKKIADEIEELKNQTIENLKEKQKKDPNKVQQGKYNKIIEELEKKLNKLQDTAQKQHKKYTAYPTYNSMVDASTKAKKAKNEAEAAARSADQKMIKANRIGVVKQNLNQAKKTTKRVTAPLKRAAQSRTAQAAKEGITRGAKSAGKAAGRGAKVAGAAAERAAKSKIVQDTKERVNKGIKTAGQSTQKGARKAGAAARKGAKAAGKTARNVLIGKEALKSDSQNKNESKSIAEAKIVTEKILKEKIN